jgi:hypothetical protein
MDTNDPREAQVAPLLRLQAALGSMSLWGQTVRFCVFLLLKYPVPRVNNRQSLAVSECPQHLMGFGAFELLILIFPWRVSCRASRESSIPNAPTLATI